jgi:hypothetical protein
MKKLLPLLLLSSALLLGGLSSCSKYEDGPSLSLLSKKARVTGKWNVKSIGSYILTPNEYSFEMAFEKNGDAVFTQIEPNWGSDSYLGTWAFASDKEELMLNIDGDLMVYEIKRLTNKEMWLDDDPSSLEGDIWKLEKK